MMAGSRDHPGFPQTPPGGQKLLCSLPPGGLSHNSSLWPAVSCRQFQNAESHFSTAIQHNPQSAQYYVHRARCRQLMQNIFGARLDIATALLLNPKQPKVGSCWARKVGSRISTPGHLKILPVPKRNLVS